MSAIKKSKIAKDKISYNQLNKLLVLIGPTNLYSFLTKNFTNQKIIWRNTNAIRMCCPIHEENTPSCDIDILSNKIHCYGCGYSTKNLLKFLSDSIGWTYAESAQKIYAQTNIKVFNEKYLINLEELEIHQYATAFLMKACNKYAKDCIQYKLNGVSPDPDLYDENTLIVVEPALKWLFKERKHNPDLIGYLPYGILPPFSIAEYLCKNIIEIHNEQLRNNKKPIFTFPRVKAIVEYIHATLSSVDALWVNSVSFHTGYSLNTPGRIRLRKPNNLKEIHALPGFEESDSIGFFGLYDPNNVYSPQDIKSLVPYIVEGENDAISWMEKLLEIGKKDVIIFATGGNQNNLDDLCEIGFEKIRLISDDPISGNGNEYIKNRLSTAFNINVKIFNKWELFRQPGIKDLDQVLQVKSVQKVNEILVDGASYNFISIDEWAKVQALSDYAEIEDPTDVREKTRIASEYGKLVKHPAIQAQYVKTISNIFEIHAGAVQQDILKTQDTEESFILRIMETLKRDFFILFKEDDLKDILLILFHKETKRIIRLPLTDGEIAAIQLATIYGPINEFFKNFIGLPSFLQTPEELQTNIHVQPIKQHYKDLCNYLKIGIQGLLIGTLDRKLCKEFGQGVHYTFDPHDFTVNSEDRKKVVYVVNGARCYRGDYESFGLKWKELEGPRDGTYIFNVGFETPLESWSSEINTIEDLQYGNEIDVAVVVRQVIEIFKSNWNFKYQDTDALFLAYHLFASAISTVYSTQVMLSFLGETHSGKSTALNVFSGVTNKRIQLLEACVPTSSFTSASIYQKWNNSKLGLALDEFEDERDFTHKAKQVADIIVLLRQIINEEGAPVERGGRDGSVRSYHLKTFVFMAAIKPATQAQDVNRRHEIEMLKVENYKDINSSILDKYSIKVIQKIRRAVTLGMLKHIPKIYDLSAEIERELLAKKIIPFSINNRTLKNFIPAASVAYLIGDNWREFIQNSCMDRKRKHETIASESSSQVLYDRIFFTSNINIPGSNNKSNKISLNELLADYETWPVVNKTGSGFFIIPELKIGVIHWITIQTSLLQPWNDYVKVPHRHLKDLFDRHVTAIKTEEYEKLNIWPYVKRLIPAAKMSDISLTNLTEFLSDTVIRSTLLGEVIPISPSISSTAEIVNDADDNLP